MAVLVTLSLSRASPSGAQDRSTLDDQFRTLVAMRDSAIARGDSAAVHRLIADDVAWVDGTTAGVITAPQLLAAAARVQARPMVAETDSLHARRVGDVASVDYRRTNRYRMGVRNVATTSRATELFVNRGGRWLLMHHTQVWVPTVPVPIALDSTALGAFVGRYEIAPGFVDDVHWSGGKLVATATGERVGATLVPVAPTVFRVSDDVPTVTIFERDSAGRVIGYVSHWPDGHVIRARRLN